MKARLGFESVEVQKGNANYNRKIIEKLEGKEVIVDDYTLFSPVSGRISSSSNEKYFFLIGDSENRNSIFYDDLEGLLVSRS